ncbi:MAG: histidine kinase [Cyclobacteriaceae bacterium]
MRIKSYQQTIQAFIWSGVWLIILLILNKENVFGGRFWLQTFLTVTGIFLVVFVNLKWLLPEIFFKRSKKLYVALSMLLLIAVVWGIHSDILPWNQKEDRVETIYDNADNRRQEVDNLRWLLRNLPPLFICLLGSSFMATSSYARKKEKEAMLQERSKLETELKFLKSQINPHFLFNTLHNIYTLTVLQSEEAPKQLLKLSDLLRYMIYDSNEESVPLKREIEYLNNFLGLAQLKDSQSMNISFDLELDDPDIAIAPLIFIPFVENAFKHSQFEDLDKGYIHITIKSSRHIVSLSVENSVPKNEFKKDVVGGIGLANVKQRLNLIYPAKHKLEINDNETTFGIKLELNCS